MHDAKKTIKKRITGASEPRQRNSILTSLKKILKTSHNVLRQQPQTLSHLRQSGQQLHAGITSENGRIMSTAALDSLADSVSIHDTNFRIVYQNLTSKKMFGDCVGEYCYRAYRKNKSICEQCALVEAFKDGKNHKREQTMANKSGAFCFEVTATPVRDAAGAIVAGIEIERDITERKQVDEKMKNLASFPQLNPNPIIEIDSHETATFYNTAAREAVKRLDVKDNVSIFFPADFNEILNTLGQIQESSSLYREVKIKDRTFAETVHLVKELAVVRIYAHDITEHKQAEHERTRLLSVLERSLNEIYMFDAMTLRFRYVNSGALRNLGYSHAEIESMTPLDIKPEFTEASFHKLIEPLLNHQKDKVVFYTVHRRADGSLYPVEVHLQLVEHEQEKLFLAVIIDITKRKRAEEERQKLQMQLLQAQKMEAVGQLAGGIAHDFNNILTAIIGYANLVSMKTAKDDANHPFIDHILSAANRAASLTQGLLAFSRKQIIDPRPVTVNSVIEEVEKLLSRVIGEDIELRTVLTDDDTSVLADTGQIEQVLINLATNARDAMPNGGQLTIETRLAEIDDEYKRAHGYGNPGTYVLLSVTDTGEGMDEKTRERIFEPFFTTKEVGKGTGLGLSIVYGGVKQHNGYINVYSEPGRGTTFTVYLPLLKTRARPAAAAKPAPPLKGGTETILLAEDDSALRDMAKGMLKEFGYTVIEAVDGQDAVEKFSANKDIIQLLILDVIMPNKNGRETFEEAKKIRPGIKALFTSGYPADIIQKKGVLEAGINFIVKPNPPQELLRKVREVLDT